MQWVPVLLLPSYILRRHRTAHIGLFLHSPFPASDVWRTVSVRLELLRSMLNVDLVGFLMFEYTRNFLTCCKRMIGLDLESQLDLSGIIGVRDQKRLVRVIVSHAGIEPSVLASVLKVSASRRSSVCVRSACVRAMSH